MAWMSPEAARIAGADLLDTVSRKDLGAGARSTIRRGWITVDGAHLLKARYKSYFGDRRRFLSVMDYEVAVNGRGIPDLHLTEEGEPRVSRLLRRGISFAWAALVRQSKDLPNVRMAAYVSVSPIMLEPDQFTGNATFCTVPLGQPGYTDPTTLRDEIVVALFSEDCRHPLKRR
ncbi:hypothetical protein VSH64_45200 [Amycolatopsis rhabdoformis]|uniref:Uncharacterized protein n=1 Tax=Amycolatopsis rhabdoformis TaxID=1448059 RepID=A0ABZ1I8Q0_9PSEU|nr:hypothetical protein [Amycolatopsis rhabdoformis]WSE29914.1 hypothetical protein VSH64_45200 [Amycolatopsis rhabdoformis]